MKRGLSALGILIFLQSPVWAHRLLMTPSFPEGRLKIEAFFEDDTPAQKAMVKVLREGRTVAGGITDDRGICLLTLPAPGEYVVRVEASGGHVVQETIEVKDSPDRNPGAAEAAQDREEKTRTPWWGLVAGICIIVALAAGWALARRRLRLRNA